MESTDTRVKAALKGGLEEMGLFYSLYPGTVSDENDPEGLGRVKVEVPSVSSRPLPFWALPKDIDLGDSQETWFIPSKGAKVWIQFIHGNIEHPVYSRGVATTGRKPADSTVTKRRIKTKKMTLEVDDVAGKITLQVNGANEKLELAEGVLAVLVGTLVNLGADTLDVTDGVVTGKCICPFTMGPIADISAVVRAKKL